MRFGNFLVGLLLSSRKLFWKNNKKLIIRGLAGMSLFLIINFIIGCYYYKASTTINPPTAEVIRLSDLNKGFVVHQNHRAYYVHALTLKPDSLELQLGGVYHQAGKDITPVTPNSVKRYRPKKGDARLLNEVHLYVNPNVPFQESIWTMAHTDLDRLDVYNHSTNHTVGYSILFGIALIPVAWVALTLLWLLAMALTGNSCPFIYTFNGEDFVFAGEIYSGSVYKPLERHDYLLLPDLVEDGGAYRLKIANQLEEIQHTNLLELMIFDHDYGQNVLVDKNGSPHSISNTLQAVSATNLKGENIKELLEKEDDLIYIGDDPSIDPPLLDGAILTFDVPPHINKVKLVIEAKNSYWLDFVYQNFRDMLGISYEMWIKKQENGDPKKMEDWSLSQNIPLSVYVKVEGEWKFKDYFNSVGPMAFKKDVLELDITERGEGPVQIKLEAGSYFWEIGFAELALHDDMDFQVQTISLKEAMDEEGKNVKEALLYDDELYYIQPEIGNEASLIFPVPHREGKDRTLVLHSKGYYEILLDPKGAPKLKALKEIRKTGNFNVYSNQLMQDMLTAH